MMKNIRMDIVACLLPLWNIDLSGYALGVVCDAEGWNIEYFNRLRYPSQSGYFNSGVLLINLEYWREHDVKSDFLNYIKEHRENIKYHDQDVLNYVFHDKKKSLPIKYNLMHSYLWKKPHYDYWLYEKEVLAARKDPVIVHFTGAFKPWDKYQRCPHPFRSTFYKYQNQTKWKGVKTDYRPLKLRLINFVADVLRSLGFKNEYRGYIEIPPID